LLSFEFNWLNENRVLIGTRSPVTPEPREPRPEDTISPAETKLTATGSTLEDQELMAEGKHFSLQGEARGTITHFSGNMSVGSPVVPGSSRVGSRQSPEACRTAPPYGRRSGSMGSRWRRTRFATFTATRNSEGSTKKSVIGTCDLYAGTQDKQTTLRDRHTWGCTQCHSSRSHFGSSPLVRWY
jgi:hypothetical protein